MTKQEFKNIFDTYFDSIRNYIYYRCGDKDLASDVAQDVFMKIWEKQNLDLKNIKALLYKMASDSFISSYRKVKTEQNHMQNYEFDTSSNATEESMNYKELKVKYANAIKEMPEGQRVVFLMSRIENLKYAEISQRVGVSVKAVEKRMKLGLDYLRTKLM